MRISAGVSRSDACGSMPHLPSCADELDVLRVDGVREGAGEAGRAERDEAEEEAEAGRRG